MKRMQCLGSWLQSQVCRSGVTRLAFQAGAACRGNFRSIECRMWPPRVDVILTEKFRALRVARP
jgi:hypothetical protein